MRRIVLALVSIAAVSGCLPTRENDFDPSNRPDARLAVVDHSAECASAFLDTQSYPVIGVSPRSSCIALDARATTDPQGQDPETLTYEFGTLDSSLVFHAFGPGEDVTLERASVAVLGIDYRQSRRSFETVTYAVRVTDAGGARGDASAPIVWLNERPIARAGAPRIYPQGGYPWSPGAAFQIAFDGSASFDADGDVLEYCWTFPPATTPVCSKNVSDPLFTRAVESADIARFRPTLVVRDGDPSMESLPAYSDVRIGAMPIAAGPDYWGAAESYAMADASTVEIAAGIPSGGHAVLRMDRPEATGGPAMALLHQSSVGLNTIYELTASDLDGALGTSIELSNSTSLKNTVAVGLAPGGKRVHAIVSYGAVDELRRFDLVDGTLDFTQVGTPAALSTAAAPAFAMAVDPLGGSWVISNTALAYIDPNGQDLPLVASPYFSQVLLRPGGQEVWALNQDSTLYVYDVNAPAADPRIFDIALTSSIGATYPLTSLLFVDEDTVWVEFAGDGIRLAVVDGLLDGEIEASTLTRFAFPSAQFSLQFVDSETGIAYALIRDTPSSSIISLFTLAPSGVHRSDTLPATGFLEAVGAVDAAGRLWFLNQLEGIEFRAGFFPGRLSDGVQLLGNSGGSFPDAEGGLWVYYNVGIIPTLSRYSFDGSLTEIRQNVTAGGVPQLIPPDSILGAIRGAPDGRALWASGNDDPAQAAIRYIDLQTGAMTTVMAGSGAADRLATGVLEPSAPVTPGATPFVWTIDPGSRRASIVEKTSAVTDKGTPFGGSGPFHASVDYASNELCVLYSDSTSVFSRRLAPSGAETELGVIARVPGPGSRVSMTMLASEDACWAAVCEAQTNDVLSPCDLTIHGWTGPDTAIHAFTGELPGPVTSMARVSDDRLLLTWFEGTSSRLGRIDFGVATTSGTLTVIEKPLEGSRLHDPRASRSSSLF